MIRRQHHVLSWLPREWGTQQYVLATMFGLATLQFGFRAWAIYGGWFYGDDIQLLYTAPTGMVTADYVFEPHAGHLLPGVLLLAWLTAQFGVTNWAVGAALALVLQAAASIGCIRMLIVLFGARWGVIPPFAVFLFSVLGVPGFVWWASGLLTGALLAALFQAVATGVVYLRCPTWRRAIAPAAWTAVGLFFYEKSIVILPVLAYVALAYFTRGSLLSRIPTGITKYRHGVATLTVTGGLYIGAYLAASASPLKSPGAVSVPHLADNLIGKSFLTGAFGGPFEWLTHNPPSAQADPPEWFVRLSWTLAVIVVLVGALTRIRTGRAWALLGLYLAVTLALLATGRAYALGSVVGLEYRYLTDAAGVLCLTLGLAFLELLGAQGGSEARPQPFLTIPHLSRVAAAGTTMVCLAGVMSSLTYLRTWHENPLPSFLANAVADIDGSAGSKDIADRGVPAEVMTPVAVPYNRTRILVGSVARKARFPDATDRLFALNDAGHMYQALIDPVALSQPGPVPDCGWFIHNASKEVPLDRRMLWGWDWWARLGYLASQDTPITITAGENRVQTVAKKGIHSLYVRLPGSYTHLEVSGLSTSAALCVDRVEVGTVQPGAAP